MTEKRWEDPTDLGIWLRFDEAVRVLATETGNLNSRLYKAYFDCGIVHLHSTNFRDERIISGLKTIEKLVEQGTISYPNQMSNIHIEIRHFKLHWKQAQMMATEIFNLYKYLLMQTNIDILK